MYDWDTALANLKQAIIDSYNAQCADEEMRERFAQKIEFMHGRKYIRVLYNGGAWGFIVKGQDSFPVGTLLKAASWKAPARNVMRGNVFNDLSWVTWTGLAYAG